MNDQDKKILLKIIKQALPHAHVYLFGSRARKDHAEESDIDIALDNKQKIDPSTLSSIREQIEESTIPFTVDLVDLHATSNAFKQEILKDGLLWS